VLPKPRFKPKHKVFVIDAGGGTIDISSYNVTSTSPLEVEEFHEPKCNVLSCNPHILTDREIGSYEGGDVVTSNVREYVEGEFKTVPCIHFFLLFHSSSEVEGLKVRQQEIPYGLG
jgi:hypothetical protein